MTFAEAKEHLASERFVLVRMTPARDVSYSLSSLGSGVYSMTFALPLAKVERNGVELTATASNPPTVDDTYYFDEATSTLKVKTASAPDSESNTVVVFYRLFFSSGRGVSHYEDPDDDQTTLRPWDPRIGSEPVVTQSVRNALAGVFTIESSMIEVNDPDDYVRGFLSTDDSFHDKEVVVWLCITDQDRIRSHLFSGEQQRIFTGVVKAVYVSEAEVRFRVLDNFSRMNQSAFFGDTLEEAVYQKRADSFPSMDPRKDNTPVPLILGAHSRYKTKSGGTLYNQQDLDPDWLYEAVCVDYTNDVQDYTNRVWGICRTLAGLRSIVVGTRNQVTNSGNLTMLRFTTAVFEASDLKIGDTVKIGSDYARLIRIQPVSTNTECYFRTDATVTPGHTTSTTVTVHDAIELVIRGQDGTIYYPLYDKHYTVATATTEGGNSYHEVTFLNNFEASLEGYYESVDSSGVVTLVARGLEILDPGKHQVFFRVRPALTGAGHGAVLQKICESAGLDVNAASFTAADTALDADVLMSVPQFDETDLGTYRDYAQLILESTLGYVFVNDVGEAVYKLLDLPSSGLARGDSNLIEGSLGAEIDYQDIVTQVIAYNAHDYADENGSASSSETTESTRARWLHGVRRTTRLRHVLSDISDRLAAHLAVKSRPTTIYKWETATADLDTDISDDATLTTDEVLGGGSVDLKVVSVEKSANKVTVEAAIIEGIS